MAFLAGRKHIIEELCVIFCAATEFLLLVLACCGDVFSPKEGRGKQYQSFNYLSVLGVTRLFSLHFRLDSGRDWLSLINCILH